VRVAFFGTPEPAANVLDALHDSQHEVVVAVTQPDRPRGRSGAPLPPPVKQRALAHGIPVLQPETPKDDGFVAGLATFAPDVGAVVAYGHLLPPDVLALPPRGSVNVHFSLLPRHRGAAPVQRAIMAGETETGVTIFRLEPAFDTGPILAVAAEPIATDDTAGSVMDRLVAAGARLLVSTLDHLEFAPMPGRIQDPALATPAPKVRPEEGEIDWTHPPGEIANLVRALNPAPGAYTTYRGKRLKVWRARPAEGTGRPGAVLDPDRFAVAAGEGSVELVEVQLEGSKRLDATEFVRGHRPRVGETLG
jgi:methionyl-tRNA formyltransferase